MRKIIVLFMILCLFFMMYCKTSPTLPEQPSNRLPIIRSFWANLSQIKLGESSTLLWSVSNATHVEIDQGIGQVPPSGHLVVRPEEDTTYTLTATNSNGSTSKSCKVFVKIEPAANVIMIEGPNFRGHQGTVIYNGVVQNVGNQKAEWVKIIIYLYKADGSRLATSWSFANDHELDPGESSYWAVLFWDIRDTLKNSMDKSKTTYEIKWDEPHS